MMAFVRRLVPFVTLVKLTVDYWYISALTKLGSARKSPAEHSIFVKPISELSGYSKDMGEVFLLWIRLYYLKSNSQCPLIIGSNMSVKGYLNCKNYKEGVVINQSNLTRYPGRIIKGMNWHPKTSKITNTHTTGWPKGSNSYRSQSRGSTWLTTVRYDWHNSLWKGRSAVNTYVQLRHYSADAHKTVVDKLNSLAEWCKSNPELVVDRKLYNMICDPSLLYLAYNNIKSKPGNMTPGIVPTTLDGMSLEEFIKLSELLKSELFSFSPARRVQNPKMEQRGTRPLSIAPPRDKIIQEAMRIILEAIFEPTFFENSHGYRPNKSCHTAWQHIYRDFKSVSWIIEGDIKKCFDTIDHTKLMEIIENKIQDRQFTKLIWKSLRAGYFEFKIHEHNLIGTPQGSIISPILANVFMHQLDNYVESIKKQFDVGKKIRVSPEYTKIRHLKRKAEKTSDIPLIKELHNKLLNTEYTLFNDPGYKRLHYVRYADDWIIGIRGSKIDAEKIKELIKVFLTDKGLTLSEEKTKISNMGTDKIKFLGFQMSRQSHVKHFVSPSKKHVIQRMPLRMRIEAPLDDIRRKLYALGILKNGRPYPRNVWRGYTHRQILILYSSIFRGYLNYYSFAHNYSRMATFLYWTLKGSCGMLLASKFNLRSVSAVLYKFGKDLTYKEIKLIKPRNKTDQKSTEIVETKFY